MTDLGFRSNPNLHRAQKRPTQSADRSTETVDGVDQSFLYLVGSENIKDGRHVGLDFYDLLIEALIDPIEGVLSANACIRQLRLCGTETSQPVKLLCGISFWEAKRGL
jgi:hypothetical protein